ncbi:MAG TPA: cysteine desulfurase family protein [Rhizomicrobium sp.]|nr:cysteine desulfurase family protein [Rhizomicrobium sp.]
MPYLDHNATSPLRPEARAAMERALGGANPSSVHAEGRKARAIVEEARAKVAKLAKTDVKNVIFTSGGSEANALALHAAIYGSAEAEKRLTRIFISAIEHDSVRANANALIERFAGLRLETLPVRPNGTLDLEALRIVLREGKGRALIAVMAANNETGVIQPLAEVSKLAREAGALLFADAIQAAGKIPLAFDADYITISSHKLGGPQGAGALIAKTGVPFAPQILGGGQERGHRAGTENVAAIAGFGAAAEAASNIASNLRDHFETALKDIAPETIIFGKEAPRLANTSNFALPGILAETAVMALDLDGVMISSGAACSSGKVKPSHVLAAMGVSEDIARCALRVSFGWNSTEADADAAIASLSKLLARAKARAAA